MIEGEVPVDNNNNNALEKEVGELDTRLDVNGLPLQAELPDYLLNKPVGMVVNFSADDKRPEGWQSQGLTVDFTKPVRCIPAGNYDFLGKLDCQVTFRKLDEKNRRIRTGQLAVFRRKKYGIPSYYFFQISA